MTVQPFFYFFAYFGARGKIHLHQFEQPLDVLFKHQVVLLNVRLSARHGKTGGVRLLLFRDHMPGQQLPESIQFFRERLGCSPLARFTRKPLE